MAIFSKHDVLDSRFGKGRLELKHLLKLSRIELAFTFKRDISLVSVLGMTNVSEFLRFHFLQKVNIDKKAINLILDCNLAEFAVGKKRNRVGLFFQQI